MTNQDKHQLWHDLVIVERDVPSSSRLSINEMPSRLSFLIFIGAVGSTWSTLVSPGPFRTYQKQLCEIVVVFLFYLKAPHFQSPSIFILYEEVKNRYVCSRSEERGGVNVDVFVDGRKLLLTFEPPSFVIAENHGTVTACKDNHDGDNTPKDCLRNM